MAYRNTARAGFARVQRNGVQIPDAERHCKVYVFSDGAAARSLAGAGKALRKERAKAHAPSQDIRFRLFLAAFPPERMRVHKDVCTKAFVALVLFVCTNGGRVHAHSLLRKE